MMLSDAEYNNLSLTAAKTSSFTGSVLTVGHSPQGLHRSQLLTAAALVGAGPISKTLVPISHCDTKTWENGVRVKKKIDQVAEP